MTFVMILIAVLIVCFGGVLLFGAPYLPTLAPQVAAALKLTKAKPGQTLLELGCGDGRVVVAAARQGLHVVGYELNPILAAIAWLRTRRYRKQVTIVWGDFWSQPWPRADAIFVFLLPRYMQKLDTKIGLYAHKPVTLVSFAFAIPNRTADVEQQGLFVYRYR